MEGPRVFEPGYVHPVVIVQSDIFNRSGIRAVIAVVLTTNLTRAKAPGNVLVPATASRLKFDSVANVSQVITLDKTFLRDRTGWLGAGLMERIEEGLRLVLGLDARPQSPGVVAMEEPKGTYSTRTKRFQKTRKKPGRRKR
jgi:mRNA interferase MazF